MKSSFYVYKIKIREVSSGTLEVSSLDRRTNALV